MIEGGLFDQCRQGIASDCSRRLLTADLPCTEYWRPRPERYEPSILDHIVIGTGNGTPARVRGMCAELACQAVEDPSQMHPDFREVSDHCPVSVDLSW